MSAKNKRKPARGFVAAIDALLAEAAKFVAPGRVEAIASGLLPRSGADGFGTERERLAAVDAFGMAMDLALFAVSSSGQTAFDRLARTRRGLSAAEDRALAALRGSRPLLATIEAWRADEVSLRDLLSGETIVVVDDLIGPAVVGMALLGRVGPSGDGRHVFVSGLTPLDEAGLGVVMGFVRAGSRGPVSPRGIEAAYRHVLRHGRVAVPGLNAPASGRDGEADQGEQWPFKAIAAAWAAAPGAARDQADQQSIWCKSTPDQVIEVIKAALAAKAPALSAAYLEIAVLQLETIELRRQAGSASYGPDEVGALLSGRIALGDLPPKARELFDAARRRVRPGGSRAHEPEVDRLIGRIQALRAKTVERGCTEAEAVAAAAKVAELLDRYGLSLSALELRRQACEGGVVQTRRKRLAPMDDCVTTIAAFFDCRVWGERGAAEGLRHVFFGMPADVAAARYLYDLVEQAFETETAGFRAGATFRDMAPGLRRTASNSFAVGLAEGIVSKLTKIRSSRETALRGTGRDLIVVKAEIVDAELARLGLNLRTTSRRSGAQLLAQAYDEGHQAGLSFEYRPGIHG